VNKFSYSLNNADWKAVNIKYFDDHSEFDVNGPKVNIKRLRIGVPGKHNVENALASFIVAKKMGIDEGKIKFALSGYEGVKRRFEYHIKTNDIIYIDDYAHHPREISSLIQSVKNIFPDKKIIGIFQPHLFTRIRDFADEFAQSLSMLDVLIMLEIYPAREVPIPGINGGFLLDKVKLINKALCSKDEALLKITEINNAVILTIGAGDIDLLVQPITEILNKKISETITNA
jgi:UDP-N-acetylmuramate--alanine ligase